MKDLLLICSLILGLLFNGTVAMAQDHTFSVLTTLGLGTPILDNGLAGQLRGCLDFSFTAKTCLF